MVADGLPSVLFGQDVYPATAQALELAVASNGLDEWLSSREVAAALHAMAAGDPTLLLVTGDSETIAAARAVAMAEACGATWAAFDFNATAAVQADRVALTHALARGALPIFRIAPADGPGPARLPRIDGFPGPVVFCGRRGAIETNTRRSVR